MSNTIQRLYELGQSVWCDNLSRAMIDGGELARLIELGVVGITSNPTIFMKAISGSRDYDARMPKLLARGANPLEIYEELVLPDIADAADLLRPVYERTGGVDGFVSLEVSPRLADDTAGTVEEARRLFARLNRPNVFIKVPATDEGIPAIETLIGEGIHVNVTLIFSLSAYERVMQAYLRGLEERLRRGGDVSRVSSVASFFVSRVDTLVDKLLEDKAAAGAEVEALFGQAANANAKLAYARFLEVFDEHGPFGALAARGAQVQRPLWASTSTKNPAYPDTIYVDPLVGPHTVNTMPPATLEAVLDHGRAEVTIGDDIDVARTLFDELREVGIEIDAVTAQLLREGVAAFSRSFDELLDHIARQRGALHPA